MYGKYSGYGVLLKTTGKNMEKLSVNIKMRKECTNSEYKSWQRDNIIHEDPQTWKCLQYTISMHTRYHKPLVIEKSRTDSGNISIW